MNKKREFTEKLEYAIKEINEILVNIPLQKISKGFVYTLNFKEAKEKVIKKIARKYKIKKETIKTIIK